MKVLQDCYASIKTVLADGGYRGDIIETVKSRFGYLLQVVLRQQTSKAHFRPVKGRWIVERTFAWFDNDRRHCRNYELLMESAEEIGQTLRYKIF
jgi:transposase